MTDADILKILQSDLNFLVMDEPLKAQLNHYIDTAKALIQREGVTLVAPFSVEDGELIEMYAAYLFRKRATGEAMPRMLRWALNNRLFGEKAKAGGIDGT